MRRLLCILLCLSMVFMSTGCFDKEADVYKETEEQVVNRENIQRKLIKLYEGPSSYKFKKPIEDIDYIGTYELQGKMTKFFGNTIEHIHSATLFIHSGFTVYCVVFAPELESGERGIFLDTVITRFNEGEQLIVLQKNLTEDEQRLLIDKLFSKESKSFKELYGNRKNIEPKSTALSMTNEVIADESVYERNNRKLVWSEEFENVSKMSDTNMSYYRTMNNSSLRITNDDSNVEFKDGTMIMYAKPDDSKRFHYSVPDGITTYHTMAYAGGYLEMRAKVPFEHGAWPSFWAKSHPSLNYKNFYSEIDIFEVFSSQRSVYCNIHKFGETQHQQGGKGSDRLYEFSSNEEANQFHTYGFEWTDTEYKFYIDGECYSILYIDEDNDFAPSIGDMSVFKDYHYIILNNFIFNDRSSWAPEDAQLPMDSKKVITYTVDYIRLYQGDNDKIILFD